MERDFLMVKNGTRKRISTHTLTWSVTRAKGTGACPLEISTHTLTWSVTDAITAALADMEISTHTLTWSVT